MLSSNLIPIGKLGIFLDLQQINTSIVPSKTLVRIGHKCVLSFWESSNGLMFKASKTEGFKVE